jgi:hypothetical protein
MNRRDAAMLAHLDAIEGRITGYLLQILARLDKISEDLAGVKVDAAIHRHDDD